MKAGANIRPLHPVTPTSFTTSSGVLVERDDEGVWGISNGRTYMALTDTQWRELLQYGCAYLEGITHD